ncbi:MAG TPA: SDR family oxidoreductase [Geobacteraceae bacterium]|nr:SDR family oxidoreductase [Geobacteraceae bacterium]
MNCTSLYIVGCGDIGSRVARLALDKGIKVTALSRSMSKCAGLQDTATVLLQGDLDDGESLSTLDMSGGVVLYTAPPPGGGITDTRVKNFLASVRSGCEPAKLIYVSTTSVYGDCGDELVTEERPANPGNHTGKRRLDAENSFRKWGRAKGVVVVILRVAGIYGPGRIPMDRIVGRHPLLNEAEAGYSNRIHADDLARVCLAAIEKGEDGDIFNVCDGQTSKMTDYFNAITDQLGLPRLPQVPLSEARGAMTPLMFGYMTESRRIDNSRMLTKLGIKLMYPTLQEGLKASL